MSSVPASTQEQQTGKSERVPLRLLCPGCRETETLVEEIQAACPQCGFQFGRRGSVIHAMTSEQSAHYARFAADYLAIRKAEGRGSEDPLYYLALPYKDLSGRLEHQWAMRGKSYRYFEHRILPRLERESPHSLSVLDLGAGTGWLSYRLARRGHQPMAVDVLDDPLDGLGAAKHYFSALGREFPAFQAEFDRLPFADAQFDLAIFNSSFHYATDYRLTLQEVRRCLRWPGRVVVIDSPVYKCAEDGEKMREERHQQFEARYGFRSDHIPSMEYLDEQMLTGLSRDLNIRWTVHRPWYGWNWHSRPLKAWLANRRAPSRFWILEGRWGIT